jgi:branched-chain amino acid transport system substrate-binding protein
MQMMTMNTMRRTVLNCRTRFTRLSVVVTCSLLGLACSLTTYDREECQRGQAGDQRCAATFGPGATCGAAGYCEVPPTVSCTSNDQCVAQLGAGAICDESKTCALPGACSKDADCVAKQGKGATCGGDGMCALPQTSCNEDSNCVDVFGEGSRCAEINKAKLCTPSRACNTSCRESLGFGYACGQSGACERIIPIKRCEKTYPERLFIDDKYLDAVVFGNLMNRSSETHQRRENSAELAVRQASEGLEGKEIGWIFCTYEQNASFDSLTSREAALSTAAWLVNVVGVPGILGPAGSGDTSAVFTALSGSQTIEISPSATSPSLTDIDQTKPTDADPGLLWRTAPPDSLQGKVIADDMKARGISKVAIVYQGGPYGLGLSAVFQNTFGQAPAITPVSFGDNPDFGGIATTLEGQLANFDEVLFIASSQADVVAFLQALAATSFNKTIFLTDSASNKDVLDGAPPKLLTKIRGTRPAPVSGPVYTAFKAAYAAQWQEDISQYSFTAQAYDAAWLLMYGAAWSLYQSKSKTVTGPGIAQGLRKVVGGSKPVPINASSWSIAKQQFKSGNAIDVEGTSGALDYDLATEETSAEINVWVFSDCNSGKVLGVTDLAKPGAPAPTCP